MKDKLYIILAMLILVGCSSTPNVPKNVSLATWADSVSYSLGSDVGATLKERKMHFDSEPLFEGFQRTYAGDSSYVLGASIAASYKGQMIDIEPKIFLRAVAATYAGDSTLLSLDEMQKVVRRYDTELRESRALEQKMKGENNRIEGERFAEEYQKNDDVVVLESGLMYRVLNEGFGDSPSGENTVVVHYTGKLLSGTVFDSSVERGEPAKFRVNGVITGWQEALQLMKVGSKWELVIPANLAYGERGSGNIPSNSTLIFDVELLGIE